MFRTVNSNDRFIPRRLHLDVALFSNQTTPQILDPDNEADKEIEFVNYAKLNYNRHNYKNTLRSILMPVDIKVLNFFPPKKFSPTDYTVHQNHLWPVHSRKKPVIDQPEIILDMPQFDTNICHHVADWSSHDCLATIFENEVHMWYPDADSCRQTTRTMNRVQNCVKWRPDGKSFAMGLLPNFVGIWDVAEQMTICQSYCCTDMFCEPLCLEWPNNRLLLVGCSKGTITLYHVDRKLISLKQVRRTVREKILNLATSSDRKFVVSTGIEKEVTIWKIPEMEIHFAIKCDCFVRGLAWHPWKSSLLALNIGNKISLWNVNTLKEVAREALPYKDASINTLIFNPISGELVISYFVRDPIYRDRGRDIIGVLSTLTKIVEEMYMHRGPILYLLWGYGGKVLASAGADENLCLWNFFGSKEKIIKPAKKKNVMTSYMESSAMFRSAIIR